MISFIIDEFLALAWATVDNATVTCLVLDEDGRTSTISELAEEKDTNMSAVVVTEKFVAGE